MDEMSSLDSYQNDGVEETSQPSPTVEEEVSQESPDDKKDDNPKSPVTTKDEEFDIISEGTFDVDDNTQTVSMETSLNETGDKGQESNDEILSIEDKGKEDVKLKTVAENEETECLQKSTDFEEVDANITGSGQPSAEESNMLGDSDMTLPIEGVENEFQAEDEVDGDKSVPSAMDIDQDEPVETKVSAFCDEEMPSLSNSPSNVKDKEEKHVVEHDDIIENIDTEPESKDVVDNPDDNYDDELVNKLHKATNDNDQYHDVDEDDVENENESIEHVQEPEESDVCLIPDDTETQITDAEKEQAILARENAEKEDAEEEKDEVLQKRILEMNKNEPKEEKNTVSAVTHVLKDADIDSIENDVEETPSEEIQNNNDTKIIISWMVKIKKKCRQCCIEKECEFRYKNPENLEVEYLCEQSCCDKYIIANPNKYQLRRKKFLVEEIMPSKNKCSDDKNENNKTKKKELSENETIKERMEEHTCLQCNEVKKIKYFFKEDDNTVYYICNDVCFNLLNSEEPDKFQLKRNSIRVRNIASTTIQKKSRNRINDGTTESQIVARTTAEAELARQERVESFRRKCAHCCREVILGEKTTLWETMDFCNELCLGKYQRAVGSRCQTCKRDVPHTAMGKYCVRFGFDIRQFCCATCLNEFKKGLKTCSCCQKDISSGAEGFMAPVGDKEQFKDFCSQACLRRYDNMCNPLRKQRNNICAVCNKNKNVQVEIVLDGKEHTFCSHPCFSAFKFVSNIVADQCGMCCKYFERKGSDSFTLYMERRPKVFCTRICLNVYITVNRHIVSCQWCKVKKYNFDMIYKQHKGQEIIMCSINCLTLYGVSLNAFTRTVTKCDHCHNSATPQYHLTMSDASMRNFCTYQCVMQFQHQFARMPLTLDNEAQQELPQRSKNAGDTPFPTGLPKRVKLKGDTTQLELNKSNMGDINKGSPLPVISTVASLASGETETMIGSVTVRRSRSRSGVRQGDSPPLVSVISQPTTTTTTPRPRINRKSSTPTEDLDNSALSQISNASNSNTADTKIITVPPYPPSVRNVQTTCKPLVTTVGFQVKPTTATIGIQTDKDYSNKVLIPVPVPIFIPQPMYMYSAPFPVPVPIPLPIPVPIFIPTTRNSADGILKEIKKIQDKMPADPFEAELLMMAEMVAEEKHESDSESGDEVKPDPSIVSLEYSNNISQVEVPNNSYSEDVLQMALKMATSDYDQPTVDLETAMTANTITNPPPGMVVHHDNTISHINAHQLQDESHINMDTSQRGGRGRKRGSSIQSPTSPRKRNRIEMDESIHQQQQQEQQLTQIIQTEKPDINMCLKFTFGVNAWKQWVITKNADLEKSSIRRRPFKTELLQMTADELNYSLCLFVKEVRKPNGSEYAPDTIYYLVLGIQQYLYENGRIDNIFTDAYYERFTDCLDEVARKFSVLYNDSQYIVTRVEEEHLWECKQLGAHSPHVLLSTLMFFNTKHFNLTTVEEHMQLSFSHIMKHWKRSPQSTKNSGNRNVLLRFYPPQAGLEPNPRKKKVYEQQENEENPLRCPVRLYEFYLSKCPESVKTRNDVFYLQPERSCVPDSPVWYSTQALSQESLQKMLHRVKMVKEINIALLTS